MENELLFSEKPVDQFLASVRQSIKSDVKRLVAENRHSENELIQKLYSRNRISTPVLQKESMYQIAPEEVFGSFKEYWNYRVSRKMLIPNNFSFVIPFAGDFELFSMRPSRETGNLPVGLVVRNRILMNFNTEARLNVEELIVEVNQNASKIEECLNNLSFEINIFNQGLKDFIRSEIRRVRVPAKAIHHEKVS